MNIEYREGLIFTSLHADNIGIIAEPDDSVNSYYGVGGSLHNFFSKKVDKICFGEADMNDVKVDFGVIDLSGHINGLLGLDLLMKVRAVIDLNNLTIKIN
jgi:hypothetical protein